MSVVRKLSIEALHREPTYVLSQRSGTGVKVIKKNGLENPRSRSMEWVEVTVNGMGRGLME